MNSITATIRREWLARSLSGKKRFEWREVTETWMARLSKAGPPPFRLRLINGMVKQAPEATVLISDVCIDEAADAFRFEISDVLEVKHWDRKWTAQFADGWAEDDDEPLSGGRISRPVSIAVPASVFQAAEGEKRCFVEIPTDGEVWSRLKKGSRFPTAVTLTHRSRSVDVVVQTMLTPVFSRKPTTLVVSGRVDGARGQAGS